MKLSGNYSHEDICKAFQGNFSCQQVNKSSKGKELPDNLKHIKLELFFIRFEIYTAKIDIYKLNGDTMTKLCTIPIVQQP